MLIMNSTVQNKTGILQSKSMKGESDMEEKAYKTMGKTGAFNLVLGICTLVAGITAGVMLIVHGAKLLGSRRKLMF